MSAAERLTEVRAKAARVRALLDERGLDAVLVRKQPNFSWLGAGARGFIGLASENACGVLAVHRDGVILGANNIEAGRLLAEELPAGFADPLVLDWPGDGALEAALRERFPRIADDAALDAWFRERRLDLVPAELARFRALGAAAAEALETAAAAAEPGATEFAIAGAVARELWVRGLEPITVLVAADGRSRDVRHYVPTDKRAHEGFVASLCARAGGLVASATRSVAFAPSFAEGFEENFEKLLEVERAALDGAASGLAPGACFMAMQDAYAAAGLKDEWKRHHQGGLTGYLAREVRVDASCGVPAAYNRAYAWNPSAPGAKVEDTFILTPNGLECATPAGSAWPRVVCGGRSRPRLLKKYLVPR